MSSRPCVHEFVSSPLTSHIDPLSPAVAPVLRFLSFFFFNDTATTEIYTLSLHDALPIWLVPHPPGDEVEVGRGSRAGGQRSEEHTSELQSHVNLVCRLLLEKKNKTPASGVASAVTTARWTAASRRHETPPTRTHTPPPST